MSRPSGQNDSPGDRTDSSRSLITRLSSPLWEYHHAYSLNITDVGVRTHPDLLSNRYWDFHDDELDKASECISEVN